jgi:hypothetical protein
MPGMSPDDPFLDAFDRLPNAKLLTERQVAALTEMSMSWLQARRAKKETPPVWVEPTPGTIRYPVGLLREWISSLAAETLARTKREEPRPAEVGPDPRMRLTQEQLSALRLQPLRGGRRARQASFTSFLSSAAPEDEWLFQLLGPKHRPVDFATALSVDIGDDDEGDCVWLTTEGYASALMSWSRAMKELSVAERSAVELDGTLPTAAPSGTTRL